MGLDHGFLGSFHWLLMSLEMAFSLVSICAHRGVKGRSFNFPTLRRTRLKRRKLLWALYLMRDPFFSTYTRRRLESTQKLVEPIPIVGFFTEKLVELIIGSQTRYTYFSGA
nr:peroxisome biogenesis protein 16 isoform X2 [Ipomoea batatas]